MSNLMKVSSNPHIRSRVTTSNIMLAVVIALLPAAGFGIYNFGLDALILILVTVSSTVLTEFLYEKAMHRPVTIGDFSAVVTGLLLALNLPSTLPWWVAVIGGIFAILVVKMLFGGLGQNFMNPALGARCFLLISYTSLMCNFETDTYSGYGDREDCGNHRGDLHGGYRDRSLLFDSPWDHRSQNFRKLSRELSSFSHIFWRSWI